MKAPEYHPWHPEECDVATRYAIQALAKGEAEPDQQRKALDWIIKNLTRTYDLPWFPDSERDSSFAAGKQWAGKQMVTILNTDTEKWRQQQQARATVAKQIASKNK